MDQLFNPAAWAELAKVVGTWGLFAAIFLAFLLGTLFLAMRRFFGANGCVTTGLQGWFTEGRALLTDLRSGLADLQSGAQVQRLACQREATATEALRTAGLHAAEGMRSIGRQVGAPIDEHADAIARALAAPPGV